MLWGSGVGATAKSNVHGRIAETYDQLHGIEEVNRAYRSGGTKLRNERYARTLLQAIQLLLLSTHELAERQLNSLRSAPGRTSSRWASHLAWHTALLRIANSLAFDAAVPSLSRVGNPRADATLRDRKTTIERDYFETAERCAGLELAHLPVKHIKQAVSIGSVTNEAAIYAHRAIQAHHLRELLFKKIDEIDCGTGEENRDLILDVPALKDAYNSIRLAKDYDAFLGQFRVLHQVPELLAIFANEVIEEMLSSNEADDDVALSLCMVDSIIDRCIDCLQPLVNLMVPAEYYKIRENLGATSGSQSQGLGKRLFANNVVHLKGHMERIGAPKHMLFMSTKILKSALFWRDLHLALPKLLLGGHGTTSLMGSPDGLNAAVRMRDNFVKRVGVASVHVGVESGTKSAQLEMALRQIVAEVAQERFRDVQDRHGFFSRYPKIDDES